MNERDILLKKSMGVFWINLDKRHQFIRHAWVTSFEQEIKFLEREYL